MIEIEIEGNMIDDKILIESYAKHKSVWKVGAELGLSGQTVHERLQKYNLTKRDNLYTSEEITFLLENYLFYKNLGKLDELAKIMNRLKTNICRKARELNLTDPKSPKNYASVWKNATEEVAKVLLNKYGNSKYNRIDFCKKNNISLSGFEFLMKKYCQPEYESLIEFKSTQKKYNKGRRLEYSVRNHIIKKGFFAIRSAGSKTPVDVIGFKENILLFIQCKNELDWHEVKAWNIFYNLAISVNAIPIVALKGLILKKIIGEKDNSRKKCPWEDFTI